MQWVGLILLVLWPGVLAELPLDTPLYRQIAASPGPEDLAQIVQNVRAKYQSVHSHHGARKRQSSADVAVLNHLGGTEYYSKVNIGTPPIPFNLLLNTGGSDMWVVTADCVTCPPEIPRFNTSRSTSFTSGTSRVNLSYVSGSAEGLVVQDTVSMGSLSVAQQSFAAVTGMISTSNTSMITAPVSGFMGLGFERISDTKATPFLQVLLRENKLTMPVMSFFFTRNNASSTSEEPGGTFTLGGMNQNLYSGEIEYVPLVSADDPGYWSIALSRLTVNGKTIETSTGNRSHVAFETGTALIGGPSTDVRNFWAAVPGSQRYTDTDGVWAGLYTFPCATNVSATISFGGRAWPIDPVDLNYAPTADGSSICVGAVYDLEVGGALPSTGPIFWVIGLAFLRNVYSVFRLSPPSVGFAQLGTSSNSTQPGRSPPTNIPAAKSTNVGAIAGGVVGGIIALLALVIAALIFIRRRRGHQAGVSKPDMSTPKPALDGEFTPSTAVLASTVPEFHVDSLYAAQHPPGGFGTNMTSMGSPTAHMGGSTVMMLAPAPSPPPSSTGDSKTAMGSSYSPLLADYANAGPSPFATPPLGYAHTPLSADYANAAPSPYATAPVFPQPQLQAEPVPQPSTVSSSGSDAGPSLFSKVPPTAPAFPQTTLSPPSPPPPPPPLAFQQTVTPPDGPSTRPTSLAPTVSSVNVPGGGERQLSVAQLSLVQRLSEQNIGGDALTAVIQSLLVTGGTGMTGESAGAGAGAGAGAEGARGEGAWDGDVPPPAYR